MAAIDYFLKLDGITGESADSKHKGEIEVLSFSFGETQSRPSGIGGGGGAGKVEMSDFSFTARTRRRRRSSSSLRAGQAPQGGDPDRPQGGRSQQEYLIIKLNDVLVSAYALGGEARARDEPHDAFSLNFVKLSYDYTPQKADGSLDAPVHGGWDTDEERQDLKPPPSPAGGGHRGTAAGGARGRRLHRRRDRAAPAHERRADLHLRRPGGVPAPARGRARPPVDC